MERPLTDGGLSYFDQFVGDIQGEDVELATVCRSETEALVKWTVYMNAQWMNRNETGLGNVELRMWNPKVPYFQFF